MSARKSAFYEFREYFFTPSVIEPKRVVVTLYSTDYALVKTDKGWENAPSNKNAMAPGLIGAIIETLGLPLA